jgi:uncharacterized protein HemX
MWGIGSTIKAVAALLIVAILAAGVWYVMNLKANLAISQENARQLQQGIKDQQELMTQMRDDIRKIQKANADLIALTAQQRAEVEALRLKFSQDARGFSRDFGQLAAERPETIQRLMNAATRNAMRCLEIASGSPRTAAELAAKNSSEINKECPALANPNYKGLPQ